MQLLERGRHVLEERQRPRLRQVPRPRDVPDPRPPRPRDRLRRPRASTRTTRPKYLNSPETALFHKGRELYGLWQVQQAHAEDRAADRGRGLHGRGRAVPVRRRRRRWPRSAPRPRPTTPNCCSATRADVYFCFDGDRAGRGAAWKALESVLPRMKDGRQAFFLFLPDGEDPDSIVRKEGAAGFDARLREATPLSRVLLRSNCPSDVNLSSLDGKARLAERAKPLLAQIPDGAFRDLMQQRLTELTGVGARAGGAQAQGTPPLFSTSFFFILALLICKLSYLLLDLLLKNHLFKKLI